MTIGIISMVAFNLVDTYFVGQLGKNELAALSFTFPVIMVVFGVTQGIGMGATALISRSLGAKNFNKAARETTDSLLLGLIFVIIFSIIGLYTIDPVFKILGASPEILPLIRAYMQVWFFTLVFVLIPFVGNSAMRAAGNTMIPSMIMVFAVIVNAILDPLLIFGYWGFPEMGIRGAALATAISRGMTMLLAIYLLHKKFGLIAWDIPEWKVISGCWKSILNIGIPSAISRMIEPLAAGIVTAILAGFGAEAVAAFGVGERLQIIGLSLLWALSGSVAPFVGQNYGSQQPERIRAAIKWSTGFCLIWGALIYTILFVLRNQIAPLFNDNQLVIEYIAIFLSLAPAGIGFQGIMLTVTSSLNTLDKPWYAFYLSVLQMFLAYIPLAWLGAQFFGVTGVFAALTLALAIGGIAGYFLHKWIFNKRVAMQLMLDRSTV